MGINEKILKIRQDNNLTPEEFAERIGVEPEVVEEWEKGTSEPNVTQVSRICRTFEIEQGYFIEAPAAKNVSAESKSKPKKSKGWLVALIICLTVIIVAGIIVLGPVLNVFSLAGITKSCGGNAAEQFEPGPEKVDIKTRLKDVVQISEISFAKYDYAGIATKYKVDKDGNEKTDKNGKKEAEVNVKYEAVISVSFDMSQVKFSVDDENKTVTPILPTALVLDPNVDPGSLDYLPEHPDIEVDEAMKLCEEDAKNEAYTSAELMRTAKENMINTIVALTLPIVKSEGYVMTYDGEVFE